MGEDHPQECLDYVIPLNERHLRRLLAEFVDYYNHDRPHRSLGWRHPFQGLWPATAGSLSDPRDRRPCQLLDYRLPLAHVADRSAPSQCG